jgi:hypothetical protein
MERSINQSQCVFFSYKASASSVYCQEKNFGEASHLRGATSFFKTINAKFRVLFNNLQAPHHQQQGAIEKQGNCKNRYYFSKELAAKK